MFGEQLTNKELNMFQPLTERPQLIDMENTEQCDVVISDEDNTNQPNKLKSSEEDNSG